VSSNPSKWSSLNRNNGKESVIGPGTVLIWLAVTGLCVGVFGFEAGLAILFFFGVVWFFLTKGGRR
jgi:hypothetical protein